MFSVVILIRFSIAAYSRINEHNNMQQFEILVLFTARSQLL